jgi:hypothetical protein
MNEDWFEKSGTLHTVPSSASVYEQLGREIDELTPRVTPGSTLQDDLSALRVERRRLWMRRNGLGPL